MKRLSVTILAGLTALSLAACRDSRTADSAAGGGSGPVTIMVGGIDKVIYLPAKLTEQLGHFKDAGVDVRL
jgi:NitT/TauT family transport system substrate-binding protein